MNQKRLTYRLFTGTCILFLFISCNSGNKVVSSFGKRKYTKGYYFNIHSIPGITSKPVTSSFKPAINKVSATDLPLTEKLSAPLIKNVANNSGKQASSKGIMINGVFPRIAAVKDLFKNNNPIQNMPADTSHAQIVPNDYRKYNIEAITGLVLAVAWVGLSWTGFGLLLAVPGFFLSKWGTQSQKFHKLAVIGLIINLVGLVVLAFMILYELLLIANGH